MEEIITLSRKCNLDENLNVQDVILLVNLVLGN